MVKIIIENENKIYMPIVVKELTWEIERKSCPSKLKFSILKDDTINFNEGNSVILKVNEENIFYGFIFTKERDKENIIKVTAYDQLRYLKNKDTYIYKNKRADELIKMIGEDFNLKIGNLENTEYKIESRIEEDKTLFDIIENALDLTLENKNKMYVLYDKFGEITLKNIENMKINMLIDEKTGENYSYKSTIDEKTYNKIKLSCENDKTNKREIYISKDSKNINSWGVLQYFEKIKASENGKVKADLLLKMYNNKSRNLNINNVFGNIKVRGGVLIPVKLNIGDIIIQNFMLVEGVKHIFNKEEHKMDLNLKGVDFNT